MTDSETMKLTTKRLRLRPPRNDDAGAIQELVNNFEVTKWTSSIPHPYPEDGAASFLRDQDAAWKEGSEYGVAIELGATGEFMGIVGLMRKDPEFWEIGYWLGQPFWGHGYTTEAAKAVLSWAFATFRMDHIHARHFAGNEASARVLTKCGFRYTGERVTMFAASLGREVECQWMTLTHTDICP